MPFCPAETTPLNQSQAGPFVSAKVFNSSEDAHTKSMSTFETDEHLQALIFVRSAL